MELGSEVRGAANAGLKPVPRELHPREIARAAGVLTILAVVLAMLLILSFSGCAGTKNPLATLPKQPLHEQADAVISTWSAVVKQAQANHRSDCTSGCLVDNDGKPIADKKKCSRICLAINVGGNTLNAMITAVDTYCSGPPAEGQIGWGFGGPCSPVTDAESALRAALGNFETALGDLKALGVVK